MRDLDRKDVIVKVGADAIDWIAEVEDVEAPAHDVVDVDAREVTDE